MTIPEDTGLVTTEARVAAVKAVPCDCGGLAAHPPPCPRGMPVRVIDAILQAAAPVIAARAIALAGEGPGDSPAPAAPGQPSPPRAPWDSTWAHRDPPATPGAFSAYTGDSEWAGPVR